MAVGKNKGLNKGTKKGSKKKVVDPFTRKDWYDVKAPAIFASRQIGKTLVNRTQGTKLATEGLKGRVFDVSLSELQNDADAERAFRKFLLISEGVQGNHVLTNFHGMTLSSDKLRSIVKKWQTLIEANVDVKTSDGYLIRVFCIANTHRDSTNLTQKKTAYAQRTQVKAIRRKIIDVIKKEVTECSMKDLVGKLIPDSIAKDIDKACHGIYPLHDVYIRKVKVLKKPRFELTKLLEMHEDSGVVDNKVALGDGSTEDFGEQVETPEGYEPPVLDAV